MESDESIDRLVEVIPSNSSGNIVSNGIISLAGRSLKTEQVFF